MDVKNMTLERLAQLHEELQRKNKIIKRLRRGEYVSESEYSSDSSSSDESDESEILNDFKITEKPKISIESVRQAQMQKYVLSRVCDSLFTPIILKKDEKTLAVEKRWITEEFEVNEGEILSSVKYILGENYLMERILKYWCEKMKTRSQPKAVRLELFVEYSKQKSWIKVKNGNIILDCDSLCLHAEQYLGEDYCKELQLSRLQPQPTRRPVKRRKISIEDWKTKYTTVSEPVQSVVGALLENDATKLVTILARSIDSGTNPSEYEEVITSHPIYGKKPWKKIENRLLSSLKSPFYLGRDFKKRMKEFGPNFIYPAQ